MNFNKPAPKGVAHGSSYGASTLCGVGCTMSLVIARIFHEMMHSTHDISGIGSLAFEETNVNLLFNERLGTILGSLAAGVIGYVVFHASLRSNNSDHGYRGDV